MATGCSQAPAHRTGVSYAPPPAVALDRPVAHPANVLARTYSRITVAVRPVGTVPFDGLTLPLTSPDGRFIAAQHGPTPGWPALLAEPTPEGAKVPVQLQISAFALPTDRTGTLTPVVWPQPLPRFLLLGRSCDDAGFLVESPRPGAGVQGRWIGKVDWRTGELEWLVGPSQPDAIACFASLGPAGELAYCRAAAPGKPFDLVLRTRASDPASESVLVAPPNCTLACPTFSADRTHVYAFLISAGPDSRLNLLAIDTTAPRSGSTLSIASRVELNVTASIPAAFQSVSPLQTPWPVPPQAAPVSALESGLALISLESGSMAWFDPKTPAMLPLARGTIGAAPLSGSHPGLFLGAARELVYQPLAPAGASATFGADAAVIAGAFLPRITTRMVSGQPVFLLLSPPLPDAVANVGVFEMSPVLGAP